MKLKHFLSLWLFLLILATSGQVPVWPDSNRETKPWTRWWWPGNAVDKKNISRELNELAEAGIGGVEITSIYGVKGEEDRFIDYLSPAFTEMVKFTIDEATRLGMGVDLPPGSGWRLGGPFVPENKGLWSLKIHTFDLLKGQEWKIPPELDNAALASFIADNDEITIIEPGNTFLAPENGKLYLADLQEKKDMVKRASDGGKGRAIDTYNEDITTWYLNEFNERLGVDDGLIRCYFHDSFEYTGDFTTHFTEEFKHRRGYNLAEYLHVLAGNSKDPEITERIYSDYRQTLGELVLESFIRPMTKWANDHGSLNRNQAHGSPGNVLDLYAACDIPETEIFGRTEPGKVNVLVNKFASSAAHVTGQHLVSAESFTWLGEHWTVTPAEMIRATNRLLLSGVNHMIFHGTCYSPDDAEWPGWLFYASSQINNRNPLWHELPALFKYIERSQSILQKATPQNDILIYWPYYDVIAKEGDNLFFSLNIDKGDKASWFNEYPTAKLSQDLLYSGYCFDYISDRQLLNSKIIDGNIITEGRASYKAIVIPETNYIPLETFMHLEKFINEGGKVFFSNTLPHSVPGINNYKEREQKLKSLKRKIQSDNLVGPVIDLLIQAGITGENSIKEKGFHYLKMKMDNEDWYLIMNCGEEAIDNHVDFNIPAQEYLFYNPEQGTISKALSDGSSVRIQLEPERGLFVRCSKTVNDVPVHTYVDDNKSAVVPEGFWQISFLNGGPVIPGNISAGELISWTRMGDKNTSRFAGTARYSLQFLWEENTSSALLNLGEVRDCARVRLNGKDYGTLLGPSFRIMVDNLNHGKNLLEIEVTNVAANRIRDLDMQEVDWKKFHDINFVNIDYKPFDASEWEVKESGLMGNVVFSPL